MTVSYAVPTTGTVIEDTAGNETVAFEDFPVTNNSTVANTTPPVPLSAEVGRHRAPRLTLTFNEDLDIAADSLPPADAFTVKADGADGDEDGRGDGAVRGARHRSGPLRPDSAR